MTEGLADDMALRVASDSIHSKTFGDEVVVIDMASGLYFSLRGSAVDIWSAVEAGAAPSAIAAMLAARYDGEVPKIEALCQRCLLDLVGHGLVSPEPARSPAPQPAAPATRSPFVEPQIERYLDMQDLLLLDPVHEVTEAGWPHPSAVLPQRD